MKETHDLILNFGVYRQQVSEMTGVAAEEITLIHGMTVLAGDSTLEALGLEEESTINMVLSLCGGKKKRKKKVYTKPKRIAHKHKKRPKAILEYFNVDNTGKIVKLKIECEKCPPGKSRAIFHNACLWSRKYLYPMLCN
jgi:ubiquitin-small subunit ribosomal protein S27Ae